MGLRHRRFGSEAVFAPKTGADRSTAEDDGYVITLVTDSNTWQSDCLVFDATDIDDRPRRQGATAATGTLRLSRQLGARRRPAASGRLTHDLYRMNRSQLSRRIELAHLRYKLGQGGLAVARCRVRTEEFRRSAAAQ